jgi:hypothetical protein
MEQIILDISSKKDAALIKELLKRFNRCKVNDSFVPLVDDSKLHVEKGIKDADEGKVKPRKKIIQGLRRRIKNKVG